MKPQSEPLNLTSRVNLTKVEQKGRVKALKMVTFLLLNIVATAHMLQYMKQVLCCG